MLRSIVNDIIDLYEVNRKECARILFDSARWLRKGTFTGKSTSPEKGIFGHADDAWQTSEDGEMQGGWVLDDFIVEVSGVQIHPFDNDLCSSPRTSCRVSFLRHW